MELTPKQTQFLAFIQQYKLKNGYSPSQTEIAKALGYRSLGTVQDYFAVLAKKGVLTKEPHSRREVSIHSKEPTRAAGRTGATVLLPVLGKVAAGRPIQAAPKNRSIEVPTSTLKKSGDHFVLEVTGDSMIEDHICDGDYVILRSQTTAENGDTVVALIENEATLKKFYKKQNRIELHPANSNLKPIVLREEQISNGEFRIAGVLAGLVRSF